MDESSALLAFSALAQPMRLNVFRALVAREPEGAPAGEVARLLGVPHNTLSTHLAVLTRAGLARSERRGRSIVYRADPARVRELVSFLMEDCCGGRAEACTPVLGAASPRCGQAPA